MKRIQELSNDEIHRLAALGKDTLSAISPPIASLVYGDTPDQLQALQNIGPDALGAISPQLADYIYGPDTDNAGQGVGQVIDPDTAEKGLGRFPDQVPPPPFTPDTGEMVVWWSFADACEVCLDNAADPPRPYGKPFSSGSTEPPEHDHCRCELVSAMRGSRNRIFELSSRY